MSDEEDDIVLSELSDEDLVQQMHDDLYDGLTEEIVEGTQILLDRGWGKPKVEVMADGTGSYIEALRLINEQIATNQSIT